MRFAAVQFDIAWEDKPANHAVIEQMIDEAGIDAGAFVLLPELGDTGFSFNLDRIVDERTIDWACRVARQRGIWLQPGFARRPAVDDDDGKGRNCAAIVSPDGEVAGIYEKVHPFSYGREIEHFSGGDSLLVTAVGPRSALQKSGRSHADGAEPRPRALARPGEPTAERPGLNVCPLICYDLRFPELWRLGAVAGAEIYTIGASWPAARQSHWRALLIARAIENQAYIVAVNRVGRDPHIAYAGGSLIVSPVGDVLAEAGEAPAVIQADLDPEPLRHWRATFPALNDLRRELLGTIRTSVKPAAAAQPTS